MTCNLASHSADWEEKVCKSLKTNLATCTHELEHFWVEIL